jgi:hypothetical protein
MTSLGFRQMSVAFDLVIEITISFNENNAVEAVLSSLKQVNNRIRGLLKTQLFDLYRVLK